MGGLVWQQWVLIALYIAAGLVNVAMIGKRRDPITPGGAVGLLIIDAAVIAMVVTI